MSSQQAVTIEEAPCGVDKSGDRVRGMFAEIAPRYDVVNRMLSGGIDVWWRHVTVSRAPPPRAGAMLDVCTGTGDLALAYRAKCGPDVRIVASDFCRPMLERGIEKSVKTGAAIEWVEADSMALPFPAATFDLVTVAFGLRNIADTSLGLAEMARVCSVLTRCRSRLGLPPCTSPSEPREPLHARRPVTIFSTNRARHHRRLGCRLCRAVAGSAA